MAPTTDRVVVRVESNGVLVKFKGKDGIVEGRALEPGMYEIVAYFDGVPSVQENTYVSVNAGGDYKVTCSQLSHTCKWAK